MGINYRDRLICLSGKNLETGTLAAVGNVIFLSARKGAGKETCHPAFNDNTWRKKHVERVHN